MRDWTGGYVSDIQYGSSFFKTLAPNYLDFVALVQSVRANRSADTVTYCELACGQGYTTNLLAAANPEIRFWGFDFNPGQISNARRLAFEAGLKNVVFDDLSFEELALSRSELPKFDYVTLHGIYSWIDATNRRAIVEFLDRHLKPGGLVFVSYNALPGWASSIPIQHLILAHADRNRQRSDVAVTSAIDFLGRLNEGGAAYFRQNPALAGQIESVRSQDLSYLAHEYLNRNWHPLFHSQVASEFAQARLDYIGSATLADNFDAFSVPEGARSLVAEAQDAVWRETLRDFVANKKFRRDVFMRGRTPLSPTETARAHEEIRYAALVPRETIKLSFKCALGELEGDAALYGPMLDALYERPRSTRELLQVAKSSPGASMAFEAICLLVEAGVLHPVREVGEDDRRCARAFNHAVAKRILACETHGFLASPVIGNGVYATYSDLIAILALCEGHDIEPREIARMGWSIMSNTGARLVKDGRKIVDEHETVAQLDEDLEHFFARKLPLWRDLGVL